MKIAVLTDSSAALTPTETAALHVATLHLPITLGNAEYRESLDASDETIIRRAKLSRDILSLGQNSLQEIGEIVHKLSEQGYEACVAIHISSGISGLGGNLVTYSNMRECPIPLYVFDSRATGISQKHQVLLACALAKAGFSPEDILSKLAVFRKSQQTYLFVNDVHTLLKTGHISNHLPSVVPVKTLLRFNEDGCLELEGKVLLMKNTYEDLAEKLEFQLSLMGSDFSFSMMYDEAAASDWSSIDEKLHIDFPRLHIERMPMKPSLWSYAGKKSALLSFEPDWKLYV